MQTKKQSLIESVASMLIGMVVAFFTQLLIFPMFGLYVTYEENFVIMCWFTIISVIRSYFVRRFFNKLHAMQNQQKDD